MAPKSKFFFPVTVLVLMALVLLTSGCNRSALRIPGASLSFPKTPANYTAKTVYPHVLVVSTPVDQRSQHYGEQVAGTKWTSCSTDPLWGATASQIVQQRLVTEFQTSGLFSKVATTTTSPDDVIMKTEINAFCSKSVGFLILRVAGICSLRITLEQNGKVLFDRTFERVVTDADKEYTGSQVTFIEQVMKVTMADSLRELLKDMLKQTEAESTKWNVTS